MFNSYKMKTMTGTALFVPTICQESFRVWIPVESFVFLLFYTFKNRDDLKI